MNESVRYIIQILGCLALILSFGTSGYLITEDGLSLADAFYLTVTTVTPMSLGDMRQLSPSSRMFAVFLVFFGFGAVALFATQFARILIESELQGVGIFTRRQMRRRLRKMTKHYIICGFGEIGSSICTELRERGIPFVVIEISEESVSAATELGYSLVKGNATTDAVLREAGVERAAGVIVTLSDDADNLYISLAARELNPKILIVARGEKPGVENRILRAGADVVVSPLKLGGRQMAQLILQQAGQRAELMDDVKTSSVLDVSLSVYRHSGDARATVADAIQATGALAAAAVKREDGSLLPNPPMDMELSSGESVIVVVRSEAASRPSLMAARSNRKILLADDHRALRVLLTRKIQAAGHDIVLASNGDEALDLAEKDSPDLIVLDVFMPGKDGYEVCRLMKDRPRLSQIPIILYSADETDEFLRLGHQAGADACVRKSSKCSEVLEKIEQLLPPG